jgi:ABC-type Zn uptake system ZnuABC Zn-binding protein ZnuA
MKKIFYLVAVIFAMTFASCGNTANETTEVQPVDTPVVDVVDTVAVDTVAVDTVAVDTLN